MCSIFHSDPESVLEISADEEYGRMDDFLNETKEKKNNTTKPKSSRNTRASSTIVRPKPVVQTVRSELP
jgi:hypothetical protein